MSSYYEHDISEFGNDLVGWQEKFVKQGGNAFKFSMFCLVAGSISLNYEYNVPAYIFLAISVYAYQESVSYRCLHDILGKHWRLAMMINRPIEQLDALWVKLKEIDKKDVL